MNADKSIFMGRGDVHGMNIHPENRSPTDCITPTFVFPSTVTKARRR